MGHSSKLPIKAIIIVAADALLEVVAGDNTVGIEQEPNRIVNGGAAGQRCILHTVECLLIAVGEQPCLSISRK